MVVSADPVIVERTQLLGAGPNTILLVLDSFCPGTWKNLVPGLVLSHIVLSIARVAAQSTMQPHCRFSRQPCLSDVYVKRVAGGAHIEVFILHGKSLSKLDATQFYSD